MMMTEAQLVKKIRELKKIRPRKDWVVLTKNQILPPTTFREASFWNIIFSPKKWWGEPVFVVATAIMLLLGSIAGFFYLTKGPIEIAETPAETEQAKMIILALEELQTEVNQTTDALKKIKEPQKVLEARNVVVPTIAAIRNVITKAERLGENIKPRQGQVLATKVDELESALDEMIAIQARNLIQDLGTRTLTEVQQEILEKAKQAYNKGNYDEALVNAIFVGQLDR